MPASSISVIIPVFNEQELINSAIAHLRAGSHGAAVEILVADGGPGHDTLPVIEDPGVVKVPAPRGRALQMNAAAGLASGDVLLFLHVDTRLPETAFSMIQGALADSGVAGGAFDLEIASRRPLLKLVSRAGSLRSRLTRVPYGDQGIFLRRSLFEDLGGFAEIPIMEDLELMRRIKRSGKRIVILSAFARTSARRWEKEGVLRGTLRNWTLRLLFHLGVPPQRLVGRYRPHR